MSPALVDPRPTASHPPRTLPKQTPPPPRNPRTGESIPDVAPPAIPSSSDRVRTPTAAMDSGGAARGTGERNLESVFQMLFPPQKVEKAPQAAAPGLSKPRFVKVRRHYTLQRVRPGAVASSDTDDAGDPGFNPFRWCPPSARDASGPAGRAVTERTDRSSSGEFECAESGSADFAFGGSWKSERRESAVASAKDGNFTCSFGGNGNYGGLDPGKSENASFVFAAGLSSASSTASHLKTSGVGDTGNASHKPATGARDSSFDVRGATSQPGNSKQEGMCSSSSGFEFASGSKKGVVSDQSASEDFDKGAAGKLREELKNLNIRGSGSADNIGKATAGDHSLGAGDGSGFVFGTNKNVSGSLDESNSTAGFFVFGSSSKKWNAPDLSSTNCSDKSSVEKLPEEIQKLNIKESTLKNWSTEKENVACKFTATGSGSSGAETIPNASMFDFGTMPNHSNFDENMASRLPDEMRKLNIEVPGGVAGFGKMKGPNYSSESDKQKVFIFGSNQNMHSSCENCIRELPEELKTVNPGITAHQPASEKEEGIASSAGVFVFGSNSQKSTVSDQNAVDGLEKSATGKLPEEMQKLNIRGSRNTDSVGKAGVGNDSLEANAGCFGFGSSKNVSGSFGEGNNTADVFVFGSSSKNGNVPDLSASDVSNKNSTMDNSGTSACGSNNNVSGFDQTTFNKHPDVMQKLNIVASGSSSCHEKAEGGDYGTDNGAFVFGSKKDSSVPSGESNSTSFFFVFGSSSNGRTVYDEGMTDRFDKGNELQDEMQKLNIKSSMDNDTSEKTKCKPMTNDSGSFVSGVNENIPATSGNNYTSASQPFSFHVTNQDESSGVGGVPPAFTDCNARPTSYTNTSSCSSSFGSISQSSGYDFTFAGHREGLGTPQMNFRTTKQDASWYSKDNFVPTSGQNVSFNVQKGAFSHSRSKKRRGKLRDSMSHSQRGGKEFNSRNKGSQVNSELDSTGEYSPMDFSPCQLDTSVAGECSREASVTSEESMRVNSHPSSTEAQISGSMGLRDDDLVHATECLDINEECFKHELHDTDTKPRAETEFEKQAGDGGSGFTFAPCSNGTSESSFTFAATPSSQGSVSALKHSHRRKFKTKVGRDPCISNPDVKVHFPSRTAQLFPDVSISSQLDSTKAQPGVSFVSPCSEGRLETNRKPEVRQESISKAAASTAAQEACEKWRLRGNQAYANGDLSKAEEYYTRGVNSISPDDSSRSCTHALMLCYSNRAASRMSIGRIREALSDCMMAAAIDPDFLRAQLRAANCHLLLGEIENACSHFKKCLPKGSESCVDRKFVLEASDGLQKAKQIADYMEHAAILLQKRTTDDAISAVQIISDALSLSPYSESLIEMKAEALLTLRRYDEVIQLCDETLDSAELNSCSRPSVNNQFKDGDNSSRSRMSPARAWRCYLKSRAYFCSGRLEDVLSLLHEQEQVEGITDRSGSKSNALALLSATVHELLRLKTAGNVAFKAGRHSEAVEHYTAALSYNIESRPFAAVCFCNRAAAYQALGQITDAISDCSSAIALDPNYSKAISRRATLHEMIRDYGQASNDLRRLLSLLERKLEDRSGDKRATSNGDDPESARLRLAKVEEKARKEIPLDMYLILGIESSTDAAEIKKAYRKAALRHHPDKAGQFLVRSENADEGLWKEVADEVHRDADHLFKVIGEAYAVLSDPSKRLQYDTEEEIRTSQKGNSGASTPRGQPDFHSNHFERSSNRWQSRDNWRSYGSSNPRWSSSYRTNRYF